MKYISDYVDLTVIDRTKFNIISSGTGTGKAQPLYSKIKTLNGWIAMGNIRKDDIVVTPEGKESKVINIFPQGKQEIYRVHFKDGRFADCTSDHLWKIYHHKWNETSTGGYRILSLKDLYDIWGKSRNYSQNHKHYYIPLIDWNINNNHNINVPIKPYLLGALLGDGCFTANTNLLFSTADKEILDNISQLLEDDYEISKLKHGKYDYNIKRKSIYECRGNSYITILKELNLFGKLSHEKFIPEIYKQSSNLQKLYLLQGLMDTDGTADKCGNISFSSTSLQLAKDVQEMVWSLGGIARITNKNTYYKYKGEKKQGRISYIVHIRVPCPDQLFTLHRKQDRVQSYQYSNRLRLEIVNIEPIGVHEAQCIMIEDKNHLYITDNFIVTHNTYFIANELRTQLPHIKPIEILFIASRSLIVEQQSKVEGISKYNINNISFIKHWNGEEDSTEILEKKGIQIMTYDKIINILVKKNTEGLETLSKVKIVVFDECHTLFSDLFIKDIEMLKVWIRDVLYREIKIIIGLTATPSIIEYYQGEWGVSINRLNKEILINHKVKQLHCTDFDTIPFIVTTKLDGKTLIMCYSYKQCKKLKEKIPNSFILISKSNKYFTNEMNKIRQYIIDYESLPDTFIDEDGIEKELNVLITTSTLREGVNLRENSGVKNIVCCFSDELHITQFVGRARYSIDNLVVADTYINADNMDRNAYLTKCRINFRTFIKNKDNTSWFDSIAHLIQHDIYDVKRFILNHDEKRFIDYINMKWLVPKGISDKKELDKYKIYKGEHKQEIIDMIVDCKLLKLYPSRITFLKAIDLMENNLGYVIESQRGTINKKQHTYKLVVDFDGDKINLEETNG